MATIATELIEAKRDDRGRAIRSREERAALVRAYETSGLTQKAFAQREGVKYPTFVSWVQQARREAPAAPVGFAEVALPRSEAPVEVQLPDGTTIRGTNVEAVAQLLQLLRC